MWDATITRDDGEEVDVKKIRVPVSSTGTDRDGDQFSDDGLEHMVSQYKTGEVPMFPNHGLDPDTGWNEYRFEHMMGGWKDAEIEEEGDQKIVYAIGALSPDSEEADTLERQIENGVVPVSFSVGFMPINADTRTNEEGEPVGREFHEHDLFETSPVGIPSNPDATVANAARMAAKGAAVARGIDDPEAIEALAKEITAEVKAGTPLDHALDHKMQRKQTEEEYEMLEEAIAAYLDETDGSEEDSLATFAEWAEENKGEEELAAISDVLEEFLENTDGDMDSETLGALSSWVEEQLEGDDDGEEEGSDGDEDEDEDDEETDSTGADGKDPETLTVERHKEILTNTVEPIQNELVEIREMIEALGEEPEETDEADGDDSVAEELEALREELSEVRERNEELEERLDEPQDPKGTRGGIVQAGQSGEESDGTGETIESTAGDAGNSPTEKAGDDEERLSDLASRMKGN